NKDQQIKDIAHHLETELQPFYEDVQAQYTEERLGFLYWSVRARPQSELSHLNGLRKAKYPLNHDK
ncbi:MAG: hypothetical protein ACTHWG_08190, partial [Psychrobacter sp.]